MPSVLQPRRWAVTAHLLVVLFGKMGSSCLSSPLSVVWSWSRGIAHRVSAHWVLTEWSGGGNLDLPPPPPPQELGLSLQLNAHKASESAPYMTDSHSATSWRQALRCCERLVGGWGKFVNRPTRSLEFPTSMLNFFAGGRTRRRRRATMAKYLYTVLLIPSTSN